MRIIVTGLIAQHPLGGVTWDYVQYVVGLARLGHDVYYFEDSGQWPYALDRRETGTFNVTDGRRNAAHLATVMARFGLDKRWAYRCAIDWEWFGLAEQRRREVLRTADLLINVSSTLVRPAEYREVPRLAFIDSDPVFTQIKLATGQTDFQRVVDAHDVHFTFGEALSANLPATGHNWLPTRQPVLMEEWRPSRASGTAFTTVMNWDSYNPVIFRNRSYGMKDVEFMRFLDLPSQVAPERLEIAMRGKGRRDLPEALRRTLVHKGWTILDPNAVCADLDEYRRFIESSKAEWSVAKNGYVVGQAGWFSCRSACYLAAGRPVVVQDTGFSAVLPVGAGLLSFGQLDEAATHMHDVSRRYAHHARAARELAEAYFDSDQVLTRLIEQAMAPSRPHSAPEAFA